MKLQIKPEYLDLVPRLDKDQTKSLKNSMNEDGQQIKIIVNPEGIILDGYTRFSICTELGLEPKYVIKKFPSLKKEKEFVVSANLNRRQLTLFERGEVLFSWWKEEKKKSNSEGGYATHVTKRTGITHGRTTTGKKERLLQRFARIMGSSASVCHQLTWLMLNAPKDTKIQLRREKITITAAYVLLAKPIRKSKQDYINAGRTYIRYPNCLNCGKPITPHKTNCHVHSQFCCTKCGWGN